MSWQPKTPDDRRGLRRRRAQRRFAKVNRVDQFWQDRATCAREPEAETAYEYDLARKHIRAITNSGERRRAWQGLADAIAQFSEDTLGVTRRDRDM